MIWSYLQYLPVVVLTIGAALVTTFVAWDTLSPLGYWPAIGLLLVALGLELTKPFAVRAALYPSSWRGCVVAVIGAAACVGASGLAEWMLVSRGRAVYTDQTRPAVTTRAYESARVRDLRGRLAAIPVARSPAELAPLIERGEEAHRIVNGRCQRLRVPEDREMCERLPQLKSEAARGRARDELMQQIDMSQGRRESVQGVSPEARSATAVLGWLGRAVNPGNVDQGLSLLLIVLYQLASIAAASFATPRNGAETAVADDDVVMPENTAIPAGYEYQPPVANSTRPILSADQELQRLFLVAKGGRYAGSRTAMRKTLGGWGARRSQRVLDELVELGVIDIDDGEIVLKEGWE